MKRSASAFSLMVLLFAVAVQAQASAQTDREVGRQYKYVSSSRMSPDQELIKLENEWVGAWVKRDAAYLDRIMASDYKWTDPEGYVRSKVDNLALAKSGVITSWELADMSVRVYGDAAVVYGTSTVKETDKGKDFVGHYRWTNMWIKDYAGRWQCAAGQSSRIGHQ